MIKIMKKLLYLPLVIISLLSCEDVVDVNLRNEDTGMYVVDGTIETGSAPYLFLSRTVSVTEQMQPDWVSGANVQISDDLGRTVTLVENDSIPGFYTTPEAIHYVGRNNFV